MPNERLQYLFEQHIAKTCTEAEKQELAVMLLSSKYEEDIQMLLQKTWDNNNAGNDSMPVEKAEAIIGSILNNSQSVIQEDKKVSVMIFWRRIAAAVILIAGIGTYFIVNNKPTQQVVVINSPVKKAIEDIKAPLTAKAHITLADGSVVPIDSISSGTLATKGNVHFIKTANGQIIYNSSQQAAGEIQYNTLNNPRGSKVVDMTLADGSRVWLNAGSSITYPVAFVGNERKVAVTGEAYFEVVHNSAKPFKVSYGKTEITDLGTQFNVNAYENEAALKVTLLEGSVKVSQSSIENNAKGIVIKPGQQAEVSTQIKVIEGVDVEKVMAWKNGVFNFQDASLADVMRQLERWYDIDVVYEKGVPKFEFVGKLSRELSLSSVLHGLEVSKVHFRLEQGRRVVVMP